METLSTDPDRARKIEIVAYDPAWPYLFAAQEARIRAALQDYAKAKQDVIDEILARAEAWHRRSAR